MKNNSISSGLKRLFKESMLASLERMDEEHGKTRQEMLVDAIVNKGISGDARAFEIIRTIVGENDAGSLIIVMEDDVDELAK